MPFFSGGQNNGVLFVYGGHILYIICIKNCTKEACKKDGVFVTIHNCFFRGYPYNNNQKVAKPLAEV